MRILIDLLHPAEFLFFRGAIEAWVKAGHSVKLLGRPKDCLVPLLGFSGLPFEVVGRLHSGGLGRKALEWGHRAAVLYRRVQSWHPDVLLGFMGAVVAPIGRLLRLPSVVFYDTEIAGLTNGFAFPLATRVCVPLSYRGALPPHAVRLPIYKELAYLHPSRFTPDPTVRAELGLAADQPFAIVRWVAHTAFHDRGTRWMSDGQRSFAIEQLRRHMPVFVSSEIPGSPALAGTRWSLPAHRFHHALAQAAVVLGESATVSSEAAVLGVSAAFISDRGRGYTDEQEERYGLVRRFGVADYRSAASWAAAEATRGNGPASRSRARERLLAERSDPTASILAAVAEVVAAWRPQSSW